MRAIGLIALVVAVVAAASARADDALPPPIYVIKQSVPTTGTNIPKRVATSGSIPLNRRYAELTADERRLVKSQYETMADGDEPPFPEDGLRPIFEAVSQVQRKLLVRGGLTTHVDIDARGQATAVRVLKSPDPEVTKVVASVLMLTRYKPALCGGKPCNMGFPFSVNLHVDL